MAKVIPLRQALLFWVATIGAVTFLYYGGHLSDFLISDVHSSALVRWAGVFVGVLTIIPWLLIVILTLSTVDEYYHRVVLVGTAVAFVLDLLLHVGLDVAKDAQLLDRSLYPPELVSGAITWIIGVSIAVTYYRYRL